MTDGTGFGEKLSDRNLSYMRAVIFDGTLRLDPFFPATPIPEGWARIQVSQAGICGTDMEITRGYQEFKGILGHEFVGIVTKCRQKQWVGKRVVGEINISCGVCIRCRAKMPRHCANRRVLGIHGLNGCMADFCVLPCENLNVVPRAVSDEAAVLVEPLSAAREILEQLPLNGSERAVVLGDGPIGILCAWVLCTALSSVTLLGHHEDKLKAARWRHLKTVKGTDDTLQGADLVVDATGSAQGLKDAMIICRPCGTIVMKTTVADSAPLNLSRLVANEQTLLGSRCGSFDRGLHLLRDHPDMPLERLVTSVFSPEKAIEAFRAARKPGALKVLFDFRITGTA